MKKVFWFFLAALGLAPALTMAGGCEFRATSNPGFVAVYRDGRLLTEINSQVSAEFLGDLCPEIRRVALRVMEPAPAPPTATPTVTVVVLSEPWDLTPRAPVAPPPSTPTTDPPWYKHPMVMAMGGIVVGHLLCRHGVTCDRGGGGSSSVVAPFRVDAGARTLLTKPIGAAATH